MVHTWYICTAVVQQCVRLSASGAQRGVCCMLLLESGLLPAFCIRTAQLWVWGRDRMSRTCLHASSCKQPVYHWGVFVVEPLACTCVLKRGRKEVLL